MRFNILISPLWRPFLALLGGTADRSYAEIDGGELVVRFGWFRHRFPLSEIEGASPSHWSILGGIGWRTNFRDTIGLIGTYVNVVEVRFKRPQRVRMLLPVNCGRLYLSIEEPRDFIAALGEASGVIEGEARVKPKAKRPSRRRAKPATAS
jgi:hypothetical protein